MTDSENCPAGKFANNADTVGAAFVIVKLKGS